VLAYLRSDEGSERQAPASSKFCGFAVSDRAFTVAILIGLVAALATTLGVMVALEGWSFSQAFYW